MLNTAIIPVNERERISALQRYEILDTPPDGAFDSITELLSQLLEVPIVIASLVDTDRIWFKSHHGLAISEIERVPGLCASAILGNDPYIISDALHDPRTLTNPLVAGDFGLRFYAAVPLKTYDNFNLGTLCCLDFKPRTLTKAQIATIETLAKVIMDQMELRLAARRVDELNQNLLESHEKMQRQAEALLKAKALADLNITDLKQTEVALKAALNQAEAANKAKSTFLATMSHEIRTPLNAILGMSYLLDKSPLNTEQAEEIRTIKTSGKVLLHLINDVLDFSKIEEGKLTLDHQPFSLPLLLEDLKSMVTGLSSPKGLILNIGAVDAEIPKVLIGDDSRISQILLNFLGNAIKFTDQGQVNLAVGIVDHDERAGNVRLRFEVQDTGIGISEAILEQLFQPFQQGDSSISRQFGGTGLGLSIAKRLAEIMGGQVGAYSQPGLGSTFWLELPFVIDSARPDGEVDRSEQYSVLNSTLMQDDSKQGLAGICVLVVDDNRTNLDVCQRILVREGAQVILRESGEDALRTVSENSVDIILMDIHMPGMDGLEITRRMRTELYGITVPIIALTAGVSEIEQHAALGVGMNDFLAKPIDPPKLIRMVWTWVEQSRGKPLPPMPSAEVDELAHEVLQKSVQEWPEIAGIDAELVSLILDGDSEFFIELLEVFVNEHLHTASKVKALIADDQKAAFYLVHSLRGQAANLGATSLAEVAGNLEDILRESIKNPNEAYNAFEESLGNLIIGINSQLSRVSNDSVNPKIF